MERPLNTSNPEDARKEMNVYWKTTIISELHEALVEVRGDSAIPLEISTTVSRQVYKVKPERPAQWLGNWLLEKAAAHRNGVCSVPSAGPFAEFLVGQVWCGL